MLTQLKSLNLSQAQVSDVSPLSNLTQLKGLILDQTQVSDVSP
ncbi:MAG: leucine-rich repeat domain-containing protein, partial [Elainellaceae cyanobacterium]